jgi:YHS domain-containing protein
LRIIVLAILFYIGYRLLVGARKKKTSDRSGGSEGASKEMPVNDILEEDPVCNKLVPRHHAVIYQHSGKTYYFCSKECCDTYRNQQGEHQ